MFLEVDELKSVIYDYQIDEITEADDEIPLAAVSAAIDEVKSYLRPNNKKEWLDGRLPYDVDTVFAATGTARNAMLLKFTKNVAFYNIITLCNADILYEKAKDIYDRTIALLEKVNKGEITLDLPLIDLNVTDPDATKQPFQYGSRLKFNHE